MSYRKAFHCFEMRWEEGDPESACIGALNYLYKVPLGKRDAEWFYLAGLCHHEIDPYGDEDAEQAFRTALQMNPAHQVARLYLGQVLYELENYAEALTHFEAVPENYESGMEQRWRWVKILEMTVCCKLRTAKRAPSFQAFDKLFRAYDKENAVLCPEPCEIVKCVEDLVGSERIDKKSLKKWVGRLRDLVAVSGYSGLPAISRSMDKLQQGLQALILSQS